MCAMTLRQLFDDNRSKIRTHPVALSDCVGHQTSRSLEDVATRYLRHWRQRHVIVSRGRARITVAKVQRNGEGLGIIDGPLGHSVSGFGLSGPRCRPERKPFFFGELTCFAQDQNRPGKLSNWFWCGGVTPLVWASRKEKPNLG